MDTSFPWYRMAGAGDAPWTVPNEHQVKLVLRQPENEEQWVVALETNPKELQWETHLPLDETLSVHRNFAKLPPRSKSALRPAVSSFVYWFGFLESQNPYLNYEEPLQLWQRNISLIRMAVKLYEARSLNRFADLANDQLPRHCIPQIVPDDLLTVEPKNLLGVMWMELSDSFSRREMGAEITFIDCPICSRSFERLRVDQKFCSSNCKMKDYRTRTGR